jgi:hypothetical protein
LAKSLVRGHDSLIDNATPKDSKMTTVHIFNIVPFESPKLIPELSYVAADECELHGMQRRVERMALELGFVGIIEAHTSSEYGVDNEPIWYGSAA